MNDSLPGPTNAELPPELQLAQPECAWCGKPAVAFCDAWLGGDYPDGLASIEAEQFTCDIACCAEHSQHVGFGCAKTEPDFIDYCQHHQAHPASLSNCVKSKEEAEAQRRAINASASRHRIYLRNRSYK